MNAGGGTFARALALQRDQSLDLRPPRRRASSEHCRVRRGVLCVVWGTPVASAQTKANRVKAAGALGVLVGRFDHITSTCSPAYNTSNVALLTPRVFILYLKRRRGIITDNAGAACIGGSADRPAELVRGHRPPPPRRDASSISNEASGEGCALHRLDAQASQTVRPDGSRGRGWPQARRSGGCVPATSPPGPDGTRGPCDRGPRPELELDTRASPHVQQEHCKK
jgi:hypothetical protein